MTSAGNEPQTQVVQNLNTNKNNKDNLEKLLKEKPKNCYCYTDEEYLEIIDLLNKKNFDKDSMIYYKANYELEDYIIILKE